MRFHLVWLTVFLSGVAQAQEQPLQLIEQLGSTDYREREKASRELIAQGDRALPRLRAALTQIEDPVTLRRAEALFAKVRSEAAFRPTLITVDFKNVPAKTALRELCKQAGYVCNDNALNTKAKVMLKLTNVPFWEALETLCESVNRSFLVEVPAGHSDSRVLYFYDADSVSPFTTVTGPFRFSLDKITRSNSIALSNIPKRGQLKSPDSIEINGVVQVELKRSIVGIGAVTVLSAIDDQGAPLTWNRPKVPCEVPVEWWAQSRNLECLLQYRPGTATSIRELRAKVAVRLLLEERPEFALDQILQLKHQKIATKDLELEFLDVTEKDGQLTLQVMFRQQVPTPDDDSWNYNLDQRLVVLDENGARMHASYIKFREYPGAKSMTRIFTTPAGKKASKPSKVVFHEWITETREIEFMFKDIPLP
jgi:hypothetical protein